jgi:nucleoside-diphosphate-sugar epimerase
VIYVSSDAIYPLEDSPINEKTLAAPVDLYGTMHLAREQMIAAASSAPVSILRSTMLYGAEDTHNAYGPNRFLRQAGREGRITLFGAGEELRDTLAVNDAARLVWQVALHRSHGVLNLASGRSISLADMATKIAACFSSPIRLNSAQRRVLITHRWFDVSAIRQAFPDFVFTPLEEGLAQAVRAL